MAINNVGSVVLTKLLQDTNLEAWSKVKRDYLHPSLHTVYAVIAKHTEKYNKLPTFEELDLEFREGGLRKNLDALKSLDVENIDIEVALDALVNEYTQNEVLKLLSHFLDKITLMDAEETKTAIADIVLQIDEKTYSDSTLILGSDYTVFEDPEVTKGARINLGFSNKFDAEVGVYREELILIGGHRGSGKSVICSNIQVNQYEQGLICPYFTIEMKASEIMHRNLAILSGVPHKHIRHNELTFDHEKALADVKAGMFTNGSKYYEEFLSHRDRYKFEVDLRKYGIPKEEQLIIIDDRRLTLAAIDMHLTKLKAKFKDRLKLVVVDYLNQIVGNTYSKDSKFDWKPQVEVATALKNFARKFDVAFISPYQIDSSGEARFAKGILDPADVAMTLSAEDEGISFNLTKIRGSGQLKFASGMARDPLTTLRIDPNELIIKAKDDSENSPKKGNKTSEAPPWDDSKSDLR